MNREIKFRVWDKEENKMYQCVTIGCTQKDRWNPLIYTSDHIINGIDHNNYKLMQYTGLKDKNSNYIYEGDIVLIDKYYYKIKYEIGSFMLVRCNNEVDMYEQFENCWNDDVYPLSQFYWENDCEEDCIYELEVVGNIHQNSNLLE